MLAPETSPWTPSETAHLIRRAGFGGSPEHIHHWHQLGRTKAVRRLLAPARSQASETAGPDWTRPEARQAWAEQVQELARSRRAARRKEATPEQAQALRRLQRQHNQARRQQESSLQHWWLGLMLGDKAALREKMTLFWHGHFATSLQKVRQPLLMYEQNQLFREAALGNFQELTQRIASDPAMMIYLDLSNSRKEKPNENFARELLELFTLGEGHYSEEDIQAAARAFTGYRLNRQPGTISRIPHFHDHGTKHFLGHEGPFSAPDIIGLIFKSPQPARFLAWKLWRFFVNEEAGPDHEGVAALAQTLVQNAYELSPTLEQLFLSKAFYAPENRRCQIKSPIEFLIQMSRQLEVELLPPKLLTPALEKLGQVPFKPPNVAGWKGGRAWINTNTLLARYNIAGLICKGNSVPKQGKRRAGDRLIRFAARHWRGPDYPRLIPAEERKDPEQLVQQLSFRLFQHQLPNEVLQDFVEYARSKQADGDPLEDQDLGELVHLMMSTPHYQLG